MAKSDLNTKISVQKAPTRGGSTARHTRAEYYCLCDHSYSLLSEEKRAFLLPWWKKVSESDVQWASNHSILMKICLKHLDEYNAFMRFSWCARYRVTNTTSTPWVSQSVVFENIETYQLDGQDMEVYKLLIMTTKKNNIVYDPRMIDMRLENDTHVRGQTTVTIPSLAPGASMLVDVYSYYKPVA